MFCPAVKTFDATIQQLFASSRGSICNKVTIETISDKDYYFKMFLYISKTCLEEISKGEATDTDDNRETVNEAFGKSKPG